MKNSAQEYYLNKTKKMPDAEKRIFSRPDINEVLKVRKIKKIHIVGVCGTAMGSLAGLLVESGYEVSGSDIGCYPPMSDLIHKLGIKFYDGFSSDNLRGKDLIIIGNALGADNVEAKFARENNLPQMSLCEAIEKFILKGRKSLVVSGTHGKTTTTGILSNALSINNCNPGFLVGGIEQNTGKSYSLGSGKYFAIEGDEYDTAYFDKSPKFLHYKPWGAIMTSVELDHIDIYSDFEDYKNAFKFFAEEIDENGVLVYCGDSQEVSEIAQKAKSKKISYGLDSSNDIYPTKIKIESDSQSFDLNISGKNFGQIKINLFGQHNLRNVLSVCGLMYFLGFDFESTKRGVESFVGMKRRQELIGEFKGAPVIDDFAHHPAAVRGTIDSVRQRYPEKRIISVFEPRSNTSRRKIFENDYIKSFDETNMLMMKTPPLRHNDNPLDFMDTKRVIAEINNRGVDARHYQNVNDILEDLRNFVTSNDVILIMSNGSFDGIYDKLVSERGV